MSIMFLSIDLVLVIKNPFYPKEWRVRKIYVPISIIVGSVVAFDKYFRYTKGQLLDYELDQEEQLLNLFIYYINTMVIICCIIYAVCKLRRPGINKRMRHKFLIN